MKRSWDMTFSLEKLPILTETTRRLPKTTHTFAAEVVFTVVNLCRAYCDFYDQKMAATAVNVKLPPWRGNPCL